MKQKHTPIPLYHHRTDGGAEYLSDKFVLCDNGHKEGIFEGANYIVRLDGAPELTVCDSDQETIRELTEALEAAHNYMVNYKKCQNEGLLRDIRAALAKAKKGT